MTSQRVSRFPDIVDLAEAENDLSELKRRVERMSLALRAGGIGTYEYDPRTGHALWDDGMYDVWGLPQGVSVDYDVVFNSIVAEDQAAFAKDVENALDPSGSGRHDIRYRIHLPETGEVRWIHAEGDVTFENGEAVRLIGTVRDVTEEQNALERKTLMARELDHRVNNIIAVMSGIVSFTARMTDTPEDMAKNLRERLNAMAKAHALIRPVYMNYRPGEDGVGLRQLLELMLLPHVGQDLSRVSLNGAPIRLPPDTASALALVFFELSINAAKYGALSTDNGDLSVAFVCDEHRYVTLTWQERGGPALKGPPTKTGFGSILTERTLRGSLNGDIQSDWAPAGVTHQITFQKA